MTTKDYVEQAWAKTCIREAASDIWVEVIMTGQMTAEQCVEYFEFYLKKQAETKGNEP